MQALLNTAVKAARRAGEITIRQLKHLDEVHVRSKGINDFVTQVDDAAEECIISTIQKYYPEHAFLAEESGIRGESDFTGPTGSLDGSV